jgi:hypothetical protein
MRADLLRVEGDPLRDIKATRNIMAVWKRGKPRHRTEYLASIERLNAEDKRLQDMPPPHRSQSDMEPTARFGMGWVVSLTASLEESRMQHFAWLPKEPPGFPFPWSGAMFVPGTAPMQPVNLSNKKRIVFWARGNPATYRIMLSAKSYWPVPVSRFFVTAHEWRRYTFDISDFDGMDDHDLTGVTFAAGPHHGTFAFQIDDIAFE